MDVLLALQSNLLTFFFSTAVLTLFFVWKCRGTGYAGNFGRLPPGPAPAPIVGNFFQVYVKEPYKLFFQCSKKYGSVFTLWFGKTPIVVISGYQTLKDAFIGLADEFSGRETYPILLKVTGGYGVLASSGSRWKQLRRFCLSTMRNFGMGRRSIESKVQEEASYMIQTISKYEDSVFNPNDLLFEGVSNVICSIIFGQRFETNDPKLRHMMKSVDAYFNVLNSSLGQAYNIFPKLVGLFSGKLHNVFADVEKTKNHIELEAMARMRTLDPSLPPQDFIEAFLIQMEAEKHNPNTEFTFKNLLSTVWNLYSAGIETTTSTLRQSLLLMMKYPDVQAQVQKEIDEVVGPDRSPSTEDRQKMPYTDAVLHEIQRYMDLTPTAVPHKMLCDTELKNFLIPKGTMVIPLLSSVLSDPQLWKDPDHFNPENFLNEEGRFKKNDAFVVFGMGKRACLGESLARMELFIIFTSLLQRFTFKPTQPQAELNITPINCRFGRCPRQYMCYAVCRK